MRKKDEKKERLSEMPRITVLGSKSVFVENFCSVIICSEQEIQLNTALFLLKIIGKNMEIKTLTPGFMEVSGEISDLNIQK